MTLLENTTHRSNVFHLIFFVISFFVLSLSSTAADQARPITVAWEPINIGIDADLNDIELLADGQHGWVVGDDGTILITTDGGRTWTHQISGTEADLEAIELLADGGRGWVVGDDGTILVTTDGGRTWTHQTSGTEADILDLQMLSDGQRGWAVGRRGINGIILATTDGGLSWTQQETTVEILSSIQMLADGKRGWVGGGDGAIFVTTDGGQIWRRQTTGSYDTFFAIQMLADGKRGWVVGDGGTILATTDGGQTWTPQASGTGSWLYSIQMLSEGQRGWAAGNQSIILATTDGGQTWTRQHSDPGGVFWSIKLLPDGLAGWAVGGNGTILTTTDGGQTWTHQTSGTKTDLYAIQLLADGRHRWAVGAWGTILATTDSGQTWRRQTSDTDTDLYAIQLLSDGQRGWAVGAAGTILVTTDGGQSWVDQTSGTETNLHGIQLLADGQRGWVVGDDGTILATRNGGQSWVDQTSGAETNLHGIQLLADGLTGWAVGAAGTILVTTDGGQSWVDQTSGTETNLHGIQLLANGQRGWVVGDDGTILATRNGGQSWVDQTSGTETNLHGIQLLADGLTGWAAGDDGTILATRNGGATWIDAERGTDLSLWGIHVVNREAGVIVGDAHSIFRMTEPNYAPFVSSLQFEQDLDGEVNLLIEIDDSEDDEAKATSVQFRTDAVTSHANQDDKGWRSIGSPTRRADGRWELNWDPSDDEFRVAPGSSLYFAVQLDDGGIPLAPSFWSDPFTYQPWWLSLWQNYPGIVLGFGSIAIVFLAYAGTMLMLLWLRPVSLAGIGVSEVSGAIGQTTEERHWLQPLVHIVIRLLFNPWITTLPRIRRAWIMAYNQKKQRFADLGPNVRKDFLDRGDVLDAWITRRASAAKASLDAFDLYQQRRLYVALPVRLGDPETGRQLEQPSAKDFQPLFERDRLVLPIIGVGGSGKSTLACALARWALEEILDERLAPWQMLPVFVAENTEDLLGLIKHNLAEMVGGDELDDDLIEALLRHKRLLVIVDALSERSETTQQHVSGIYGSGVPLNALVITTRREPTFGQVDRMPLYTERLAGPTLIPFIFEYLRRRQLERAFDEREQLKLGDKVLTLVQAGGRDSSVSVTPLLVTMFVDSALAANRDHRSLDQLPGSVPEVYLDYLRRLNPTATEAPDAIDDIKIVKAARVLARACLEPDFVPGDVRRESAEDVLGRAGLDVKPMLLLDCLIANGAVEQREIGGVQLLRFALDPAAEHLAAIETVHELGKDSDAWQAIFDRLQGIEGYPSRVSGFLHALDNCYQTYRVPFELPDLELPWLVDESEREVA